MNIEPNVQGHDSRGLVAPSIGLIELLFAFVAAIAGALACILSFNLMALFTPFRVAILAGAAVLVLVRVCRLRVVRQDRRISPWLIFAVLAGLFLAAHLAPHYLGNQDEGYYTAMTEMMARGEPVDFVDRFGAALPADLQPIYYEEGHVDVGWLKHGVGYFGFYPLHPALMALARQLLGPEKHTAELLVAFAIVIVAIYLLTYELSGGAPRWAVFAAMLAAFNPALVFFAKFPVTEINAAAMIMPAGYHLLVGFRARATSLAVFHGIVVVIFVLGYCYIRMSFPVIAPFLICITALGFVVSGVAKRQKIFLVATLSGALAAFAVSLLFYQFRQPELLSEIVKIAYLPALRGGRWFVALGATLGLAAIIAFAMPRWRKPALAAVRGAIDLVATWILPYPGIVIAAISIPTLYALVTSGSFRVFGFTQPAGLQLIRFHQLYILMLFVSPFLFPFLLARVRPLANGRDRAELLPSLWLIVCWPVILSYAAAIPFLYYYGRYIVLEILPVAIIAIALAARRSVLPPHMAHVLAVLGVAWSFAFSVVQINHAEGEVGRPFHRIAEELEKGDVLALDWAGHGAAAPATVPLRYALDVSTLNLTDEPSTERYSLLMKLQAVAAGRVYLLSTFDPAKNPAYADVGLVRVDRFELFTAQIVFNDGSNFWKWLLPTRIDRGPLWPLYLSRISQLHPISDDGGHSAE